MSVSYQTYVFDPACINSEQRKNLEAYLCILREWNRAINLVSHASLEKAWERHILDSASLLPLLPAHTRILVDLGSGAGFPALVLKILRPAIHVHLVESDQKKVGFLRHLSQTLRYDVHIHPQRIETVPPFPCDVLTARALSHFDTLMDLSSPWFAYNPHLIGLFHKGQKIEAEIAQHTKKQKSKHTHPLILEIHTPNSLKNAHIVKVERGTESED